MKVTPKNIGYGWNKRRKIIAFAAGASFLFLFLIIHNQRTFLHDSNGYWLMSYQFMQNGAFTFTPPKINLPELETILFSLRGYAFSVMLLAFRGFGLNSIHLYWICISSLYSYSLTCVLPDIFEKLSGRELVAWKRVIPTFLLSLALPGVILYPLTDLPTFCVLVIGLQLFLTRDEKKGALQYLNYFLMGMLLYLTYNFRSFYLFNILLMLAAVIWKNRKNKFIKQTCIIIVLLAGMFASSIPQIKINADIHEVATPANPLSLGSGVATDSLLYLGSGISLFLGDEMGALSLPYAMGKAILDKEMGTAPQSFTKLDYVRLILKYPMVFLGNYITHLINYLDVRFGEVYILNGAYNIQGLKTVKSVLFFGVWYITALGLIRRLKKPAKSGEKLNNLELYNIKRLHNTYGFSVYYLVFPAVVAIPFSTEVRYFMPAYVLMFLYICCFCPLKDIYTQFKAEPVTSSARFLLILGLFNAIWMFTYSSAPEYVPLFIK